MRSNAYWKVDYRQRLATPVFRGISSLVRHLLRRAQREPHVRLTVRGRRSGKPRTTPVAMFELGDRRFLEAAFGEVDWVRNLRASGEAVIRRGRWSQAVRAVELPPETAGKLLHDALAGFRRRRLLRSLLGPSVRPPAAILYRDRLRIDDRLEDYMIHARRCPLLELLPWEEAAKATLASSVHIWRTSGRFRCRARGAAILTGESVTKRAVPGRTRSPASSDTGHAVHLLGFVWHAAVEPPGQDPHERARQVLDRDIDGHGGRS